MFKCLAFVGHHSHNGVGFALNVNRVNILTCFLGESLHLTLKLNTRFLTFRIRVEKLHEFRYHRTRSCTLVCTGYLALITATAHMFLAHRIQNELAYHARTCTVVTLINVFFQTSKPDLMTSAAPGFKRSPPPPPFPLPSLTSSRLYTHRSLLRRAPGACASDANDAFMTQSYFTLCRLNNVLTQAAQIGVL